ncbi:MAG: C45 family peptidase [Planctomycetes bacterium]|nr:C45 family peptidase [Planctomycetota bacterium]
MAGNRPYHWHVALVALAAALAGLLLLAPGQAPAPGGTALAQDQGKTEAECPPQPKPEPAPGKPPAEAAPVFWPAGTQEDGAWRGRLVRLDEHLAVLTVRGSPEERGTAHGHLLKDEVQRLVKNVNRFLKSLESPRDEKPKFAACLEATKTMRGYVEPDVVKELDACAAAAAVDATELLLAQLFGDVNRAKGFTSFCSSFAAFGPATKDGALVVGRNFDYAGHGLEGGLPLILQELPAGEGNGAGRPFVTIGYAGILNGWTALNADGLFASNNTLFDGKDSLEGMSTCFLLRKIVERGRTVEDGVRILRETPRAATTGMLVAGRNAAGAWDARFVEFDHVKLEVLEPKDGVVLATNSRQKLAVGSYPPSANPSAPRFQALKKMLGRSSGVLCFDDPAPRTIAAEGVYMDINLHCALLEPAKQRFKLAVAPGPGTVAARQPFRTFQIEETRVVQVRDDGPPAPPK